MSEQQTSTEAAIQKDVAEVSQEVPNDRQTTEIELDKQEAADLSIKSDRATVMDQIVQRRNKEFLSEVEGGSDLPMDDTDEEEELSEDISEDVPEEKAESPEGKIEVKIDGVTTKVTEKEIREYQKQKAADRRLEESAAREAQLREQEKVLAEREQRLREFEERRKTQEQNLAQATSLAEIYDELNEGVFGDNREAGIKALSKLVSQKQTQVNPVEVESIVQRTLAQREQARIAKELSVAQKRFKEEYPALTREADEDLYFLVDRRTAIERTNDPEASFWEIIDRSSKYVLNKYGAKQDSEKDDAFVTEDRIAKKRAAGTVARSTVTKKAPISKPPVKKLSAFEELQLARGQG